MNMHLKHYFTLCSFFTSTDRVIQPFLNLITKNERKQLFELTTGKIAILETKKGAQGIVFRVSDSARVMNWLNDLDKRDKRFGKAAEANSFQTLAKPYWPARDEYEKPRSVQSVLLVKDNNMIVASTLGNALEISSLAKAGKKNAPSSDIRFRFAKSEISNSVVRWLEFLPITLWQKEIDDLPAIPKEITVYNPVRFTGRSTRFFESLHYVALYVCNQIGERYPEGAVVNGSIQFSDSNAKTTFFIK